MKFVTIDLDDIYQVVIRILPSDMRTTETNCGRYVSSTWVEQKSTHDGELVTLMSKGSRGNISPLVTLSV